MLPNNILATMASMALALSWLRLNDFLAHRGWVESGLSRKIIHIGTGPLFVISWLLFPQTTTARFWAALVPLAITAQFALVGLGWWPDPSAVKAMSRTGDRREILRGPLFYGLAFVALTLIFWKDSLVGIVALMLLCGGDGLADIVGRRISSPALPWSKTKTWAGSLAMFVGGLLLSGLVLAVYDGIGVFPGAVGRLWPAITLIALLGAVVESLPLRDLDNLTVPLAAVLAGLFLLH